MLKQRLQQKLLQKLSPQQIQMIKLLEIPAIQLEQRIKKELEENPALEEGEESATEEAVNEENAGDENIEENQDEFSLEDYIEDDETPAYKLNVSNYSRDDKREEIPLGTESTFRSHLESQLGLYSMDERSQMLARHILGNLDEDGYLRRRLDAIADDLVFSQNIKTDEAELYEILKIIQDFDPPGVGARDLQECLLLQIERKDQDSEPVKLAQRILSQCFKEFIKKHYDKISKKLNITEEELKGAIKEILRLNPKPGSLYSDSVSNPSYQIVPDFILDYVDGEFILSLNTRNIPDLKLNRTYCDMLENISIKKESRTKKDRETLSFVKQKLDSAKWFIDAIVQRQNTLMVTMNAILEYQREFFADGDETKLRPMILKDIAERTGLDISTVSRVANSKYIQTHFGIFPLKYFFSEGLQNEAGEEVSTREIKTILKECIDNEDKRKPVTDEKLTAILKEKGYNIARRTVAKYREQLNIPVARLRKVL